MGTSLTTTCLWFAKITQTGVIVREHGVPPRGGGSPPGGGGPSGGNGCLILLCGLTAAWWLLLS